MPVLHASVRAGRRTIALLIPHVNEAIYRPKIIGAIIVAIAIYVVNLMLWPLAVYVQPSQPCLLYTSDAADE